MERTTQVDVKGTVELLGLEGWEVHVVVDFAPENDGFSLQLVGEEPGWMPADAVRNYVPARG